MVKISVAADCGNSPKKRFLKDFNIALAEGNQPFLLESVTDDFWISSAASSSRARLAFPFSCISNLKILPNKKQKK
ncbi:MAG: hypothetical protein JXB38_11030 [Anaerolineales bacterium]|nr:hypothetical protein [Anaerolineales bacterium]